MAKIYTREDSPYYWCMWKRPDGARARKKTGCPVAPDGAALSEIRYYQRNAQLKANKLEADDYKGFNPFQEGRNRPTLYFFDDLMLKYIEECKPGTCHDYCLKHLYQAFSGLCLNDLESSIECKVLDAEAINAYKAKRKATIWRGKAISPATIRRELGTLSSAINHARFEWNWKIPNVVQGRRPKAAKPRIIWATHEEAVRLLDAAKQIERSPHLVDFIELALNTGMRKMEMLACELSRVDLRNEVIHLSPKDQKNSKYGTIPLNEKAKQVIGRRLRFIEQHCPDTPWLFPFLGRGEQGTAHIGDISTAFRSACKIADTPHLFPHALRHTFCSWLLQEGVSIYLVKDCMRHASITQTEEYGHLVPKNRRDSVSKLDHVLEPSTSSTDLTRICHADVSLPHNVIDLFEKNSYRSTR